MAFFSWIFLTLATGVAILVGHWLASSATKRFNFDKAVGIGLGAGGALAVLGGLTSFTGQYGLHFGVPGEVLLALFGGIIGFVCTVALAWVIFQSPIDSARARLNGYASEKSRQRRRDNRPQNPWQNQYPPRPKNPPTNPTNTKKQHPWQ